MRRFVILLLLVTVSLCMVCIFKFSAQDAQMSNTLSMAVSKIIAGIAGGRIELPVNMAELNYIIRKYAHFGMFFILGTLSAAAFLALMPKRRILPLICSLTVCFLWAAGDEIHQLYVPGRTGQARDVLIDFLGSFIASSAVLCIRCIFAAVRKRN